MGSVERAWAWLGRLSEAPPMTIRVVESVLVVVAYLALSRVLRRVLARRIEQGAQRYQINKAAGYTLGLLALVVLARIWLQGMTGLATYLGLVSAGIAVALQDPLINLAGWLFILLRRPLSVGDRIQIGSHAGDVVDVRIFQFTLLEIGNWVEADQSTGRVIHVPNGWVFKHPVANYDRGFRYIWNEIAVTVTFESNWRRAREALHRVVSEQAEDLTADAARYVKDAADHYNIRFSKLTPVVWTRVVGEGVQLTMRYLCRPRERRSSEHRIWEAVLEQFAQMSDVDFAYPTTRFYDNAREGKPAARAAARGPATDARPADAPAPRV